MNVLLQKHGAKHIYKVPEGLRELCTDIAREVLRSQPRNIYCFVADYVEALLITRENAKVAVKVVNNILLGSQAIVGILHRSGLSLEQIARAAPRIQTAFRAYLDAVDMRAAQVCNDAICDEKSKVSLQSILQATGVSLEEAEKYATIIQAAFRGHYERMLLNESRGMIQWQRAATRTLEILRKAGASQAEASKAAILIQTTYRGYYTRKNLKMKMMATQPQEEKSSEIDMIEPKEAVQAVAWLDMIYEESGLPSMRANEAASIIQKAYRQYRQRKNDSNILPVKIKSTRSMVAANKAASIIQKAYRRYRQRRNDSNVPPVESTKSMMSANEAASIIQKAYRRYRQRRNDSNVPPVESTKSMMSANEAASIIQKAYRRYRQRRNDSNVSPIESARSIVTDAILKNFHQKIFDKVIARADIPMEFGNQEDLVKASEEFQRAFKDRLMRARIMGEGYDEEELVRVEEPGELFEKLLDDGMYSIGVAEDWQEGRDIEVESERDEETDVYVQD